MAQLIKLLDEVQYKDLFLTYGIRLVKGAYDELIKFPPMKDYVKNDNRLENGVQYIAKPKYAKFNEKRFSVTFVLEASSEQQFYSRYEAFLEMVSQGTFCLKIPKLGKVFRLVYTNCQRLKVYSRFMSTFTLDLIEPDPTNRDE